MITTLEACKILNEEPEVKTRVSKILKSVFKEENITMEEVGKAAGINKQSVFNNLNGYANITVPYIFFFCHYAGMDFAEMVETADKVKDLDDVIWSYRNAVLNARLEKEAFKYD